MALVCRPEIKEVKLRPVTEKADYDTKVKQAQKFLSKGAKVKLTMTFSGREMRFKDQGKEMMLVSPLVPVGYGIVLEASASHFQHVFLHSCKNGKIVYGVEFGKPFQQ